MPFPTSTLSLETMTAQSPAFVRVTEAGKIFPNGKSVLEDLSLEARAGEFISLIGPSGCGKSTLLRILAGLSSQSSGVVAVDGKPTAEARKLISFVFQDPTLLPWRTVRRNIELAMEFEGVPRSERPGRIDEMLRLVGLGEVGGNYPRQLSGGMKMRVSIARALSTSPRLLLMDEPFGALDEISRNHLNEELLRLRSEQGWTAFFVTHSVIEAVFLSTRVLVMRANPGKIFEEIAVPLPYPRTRALRSDPAFLALVGQVSESLQKTCLA
jgi:NitT/TauT family transport system ATP-binding protein